MVKRQDRDPASGLIWAPGCGPLERPLPICVGVDVGQMSDPTAICVAETEKDERYEGRFRFNVRFLERLPLGTKYPAVSQRIVEVVTNLRQRDLVAFLDLGASVGEPVPERYITLLLDATGVGRGVFDLVSDDLRGQRVRCVAATFTHGERITPSGAGRSAGLSVGKGALVSRCQALLQTGRLVLPARHPEVPALVKELETYQIKVDPDGDAKYGAFRTGTHDDLVTAVGLACLLDPVQPQLAKIRAVVL